MASGLWLTAYDVEAVRDMAATFVVLSADDEPRAVYFSDLRQRLAALEPTCKELPCTVTAEEQRARGARVRAARTLLSLSQSDLAAWLGVDKRTVGNWEVGRYPVAESYLNRVEARARHDTHAEAGL